MVTWAQPIFRVCLCGGRAVLCWVSPSELVRTFQQLTEGFLGVSEVGNLCLLGSPCVGFPGRHPPALCYHSGLQSRD